MTFSFCRCASRLSLYVSIVYQIKTPNVAVVAAAITMEATAPTISNPVIRKRYHCPGSEAPKTGYAESAMRGEVRNRARATDFLFCGRALPPKRIKGSGKADEHIIPQWLMKHLGMTEMPVSGIRWDAPSRQIVERRQHGARSFVSGGICAKCNGGWMSDLENEVMPILTRLIADPPPLFIETRKEGHTGARVHKK